MTDNTTSKIPPATRAKLLELGFDNDVIDLFSLEEAEKYSRYTPEEMQRILSGGGAPIKSEDAAGSAPQSGAGGTPPSPARKPKSDDLPYTGPIVGTPDLGPDPLDAHGAPVEEARADQSRTKSRRR